MLAGTSNGERVRGIGNGGRRFRIDSNFCFPLLDYLFMLLLLLLLLLHSYALRAKGSWDG